MFYQVTAKLKPDTAASLARKLDDGTIREQKPDGGEIYDALHRGIVTDAATGEVEFSILCYCSTPLAHERATVLDEHFQDLTTEVISSFREHDGRPFMDYLGEVAESDAR